VQHTFVRWICLSNVLLRLRVDDSTTSMATRGRSEHKQRLFSLFAQNRRHHFGQNYNNEALKLDWSDFCNNLCHDSEGLVHLSLSNRLSAWQRLSTQIMKKTWLKVVPAPSLFLDRDGKFQKGFSVAMALTVRALAIKGVSPAFIAKTQQSLRFLQLNHSEAPHQRQGVCLPPSAKPTVNQIHLFQPSPEDSADIISYHHRQRSQSLCRLKSPATGI